LGLRRNITVAGAEINEIESKDQYKGSFKEKGMDLLQKDKKL
jgi:hypothetical protein